MKSSILQRQIKYNSELIREVEGFIVADKSAARNMKILGRQDLAEDYYKSINYWKKKLSKIVEMQKEIKALLQIVDASNSFDELIYEEYEYDVS